MIELPNDGGPDECGKPYADPIHIKPEGWTPPEPRLSEARERLLAVLEKHHYIAHLEMCSCDWKIIAPTYTSLDLELFDRHLAEEIEKEITLT